MVRDKTEKVNRAQFARGFEYPVKSLRLYTPNSEKPQETEIIAHTKARRRRGLPLNRRILCHSI